MCAEIVRLVRQELIDKITAESQGKFLERVVFRELGIEERIEPDKRTRRSIRFPQQKAADTSPGAVDEHQETYDSRKDFIEADTMDEEDEGIPMEEETDEVRCKAVRPSGRMCREVICSEFRVCGFCFRCIQQGLEKVANPRPASRALRPGEEARPPE